MVISCDANTQYGVTETGQMHFNAEHAKDAEKRRESRNAGLYESLGFSAFSAFKYLRGLSKTIQTIESRTHRQS